MRPNVGARFSLGLGIAIAILAAQVPAFADWPTSHKDAARTGLDPAAPALMNSVNQDWAHTGLDQDVYAEPLVYGTMLVVATEGNTVYALDAATGNLLWSRTTASPSQPGSSPAGTSTPLVSPERR